MPQASSGVTIEDAKTGVCATLICRSNHCLWRTALAGGMGTDRVASPGLEAFIDETLERAKARGYVPTVGMRRQYGTIEAIERLVQSGDIQSGFKRLRQLDLLDWTIESTVIKFPNEFTRNARECSEWRLRQVLCSR
jgi:hypothetical protein